MSELYKIPVESWAALLCFCLFGLTGLLINGLILLRMAVRPLRLHVLRDYLAAVPWRLEDAGFVVLPVLILWAMVPRLLDIARDKHWIADSVPPHVQLILQVVAFHLPVLVMTALLLRRRGIGLVRGFGVGLPGAFRNAGYGLMLGLAALPAMWLTIALYNLLLALGGIDVSMQPVMEMVLDASKHSLPMKVFLVFIAVGIAPIAEELLFRGMVLPVLARSYGVAAGILLTSAVFGVMHMHVPSYLPLFFFSIGLSVAYGFTGSLLVPILIHATFNLVTIVLLWMGVAS